MKKITELIFIISFICFLVLIPVLSITFPEKVFSLFEYRFLSAVPEYSSERLLESEYYDEWEAYFKDRFVARTKLLELNTKANIHLLNKPVVNDVVINGDILLPFNGFNVYNEWSYMNADEKLGIMENNIEKLDTLCSNIGAKLYFVGVPEQASAFHGYYGENLVIPGHTDLNKYVNEKLFSYLEEADIEHIDMQKVFETMDYESLYFKTDHHYNYFGAYETYRQIIDKIADTTEYDIAPLEKCDIDFEKIDLPFYGHYSRKLFGEFSDIDEFYIGHPKNPIDYEISGEGKSIYELPAENYCTYNVYMGGDKSETIIKTNRDYLPDALLIGDSFTNPLETLLYYNFDEFRSIDFRYYLSSSITEYLKTYQPDIVIYLRDDVNYLNVEGNGNMNFYMDNVQE